MGSGPSCHLAEKHKLGGLILQSAFLSIFRVFVHFRFNLPYDSFINQDLIGNIKCPVFIIHGTNDEIVPFENSEYLYKYSNQLFPPLYVKGAGHNDIQTYDIVYEKILEFIEFIGNKHQSKSSKFELNFKNDEDFKKEF